MASNTKSRRNATKARDKRGRSASVGALALVAGAAVVGFFLRGRIRAAADGGHVPTDLEGDRHPGFEDRAIPAFRPDMDAPMTAAEREALRPAPGPGPTLVAGQAPQRERAGGGG